MNRSSGRITALVSGVILGGFLWGCGGSSSGGGGTTAVAPTGQTAVQAASVGSYQSMAAGIAFPFQALALTAPSGSGLNAAKKPATRGLTFSPELNLYESAPVVKGGSETVNYYTDSAGTQAAGSMVMTSSSGSFTTYSSYPVNVGISVQVTAGNIPCSGSATIVYNGSSGTNTMKGTLNLTKNKEQLSINLTLSPTAQVAGTLTIEEDSTTIQATNVTGSLLGTWSFDFALSPQNYSGTGTLDIETASLALNFTNPAGAACSEDSSGDLIVTYPGKSTLTIQNPLVASLTGTSGTGTSGGTTNISFATPVAVSWNIFSASTQQILGFNTSGQIVGILNGKPAFASSMTATPQALNTTVSGGAANAINDQGVIVGIQGVNGTFQGVVWTSPTASPVALQVPAGTYECIPSSINNKGQIVGIAYSTGGTATLYWSSSTAAPTDITPSNVAETVYPTNINDAGQLFGQNGSGYFEVWPSATGTPFMPGALNTNQGDIVRLYSPFCFSNAGLVGDSSINYGQGTGTFFAAPAFSPQSIPVTSGLLYWAGTAINNSGEIGGFFYKSDLTSHPAVWTPGDTQQDLTSTITSAFPTVTPQQVVVVLGDGSVIVSGSAQGASSVSFYYLKKQ